MFGAGVERRLTVFRNGRDLAVRIPREFEFPQAIGFLARGGARVDGLNRRQAGQLQSRGGASCVNTVRRSVRVDLWEPVEPADRHEPGIVLADLKAQHGRAK